MIEQLHVKPSRLHLSGSRVRSSGRQLAGTGRTLSRVLDGVQAQPGCPLTSAAALGLASAARVNVGSLAIAAEALAQALDSAASRYASTEALLASIAGRS